MHPLSARRRFATSHKCNCMLCNIITR
jgi:hypothetical protein